MKYTIIRKNNFDGRSLNRATRCPCLTEEKPLVEDSLVVFSGIILVFFTETRALDFSRCSVPWWGNSQIGYCSHQGPYWAPNNWGLTVCTVCLKPVGLPRPLWIFYISSTVEISDACGNISACQKCFLVSTLKVPPHGWQGLCLSVYWWGSNILTGNVEIYVFMFWCMMKRGVHLCWIQMNEKTLTT